MCVFVPRFFFGRAPYFQEAFFSLSIQRVQAILTCSGPYAGSARTMERKREKKKKSKSKIKEKNKREGGEDERRCQKGGGYMNESKPTDSNRAGTAGELGWEIDGGKKKSRSLSSMRQRAAAALNSVREPSIQSTLRRRRETEGWHARTVK